MKWSSVLSLSSRPAAGRCVTQGRWRRGRATVEQRRLHLSHWEETLPALLGPAQQKHALLAEHVPEPPRQVDPQRATVEIERDRALHLDVDLVAELHEILDSAEMDVRRVVPGRRQIFGARHVAADEQLQPHLPEAKIRE